MRLRTTALVATAIAGLLYVSAPSASALPAASRADITTSTTAKTAGVTEEVRYRRRGYRRWGGYRRPYYGYGGYGGYGYGGYGYRPYYYRPYYYGGGYPYYYRRRPGFGIYLGF
ncbi:hypothetical protein GIW81_15750 [Hyphomicrobium sp. xq]|uniref:Uncharacterized protein n=1 Tax=Hyphomicrobium album TaxID=2665159 RepID=A0A6I3KMW9_9HYPH|nr:hypothetical protein [Hyphomicrobium album]MTD95793.1 hypothetical protein [Hyphomicrobium album]